MLHAAVQSLINRRLSAYQHLHPRELMVRPDLWRRVTVQLSQTPGAFVIHLHRLRAVKWLQRRCSAVREFMLQV